VTGLRRVQGERRPGQANIERRGRWTDVRPRCADNVVESIQLGDKEEATRALHELVAFIRYPGPATQGHLAAFESRQGSYLAASGTLTQFNGIVAAALATALATLELGSLRFVIVAAVVMHVLAALVLCWAARPVSAKREATPAMQFMGQAALVDYTFRNYRLGWRMTMAAPAVTSVAGVLFLVPYLGGDVAGLTARLF
jgi:hypothetical protein